MPKRKTTLQSVKSARADNSYHNIKPKIKKPPGPKPGPNRITARKKPPPIRDRIPIPPSLENIGRDVWLNATQMLIEVRVLMHADIDMLRLICEWHEIRMTTLNDLRQSKSPSERALLRKELAITDERIFKWSRDFGLTPIARENSTQFKWTGERDKKNVIETPREKNGKKNKNPFETLDENIK